MTISILGIEVSLTVIDIEQIQAGLLGSGFERGYVDYFDEQELLDAFWRWHAFVDGNWDDSNETVYEEEIWVRDHIQHAIERSTAPTRSALERAVAPIDRRFKIRMQPAAVPTRPTRYRLGEEPYFWVTHTIHPGRMASTSE